MPLFGNYDGANSAPKFAPQQFNMNVSNTVLLNNSANTLFQNTTANGIIAGKTVGLFGVATQEVRADANGHGYHCGWVLRTVGTGLRAGRVTYETLVAMSNGFIGEATSDAAIFPDYRLVITTGPTSNSGNANLTYSVVAASVPVGATLQYKWQQSYAGALPWADIPNTAGVWFNNTSPTLTANGITANANTLRVLISSATSANIANIYTANVTVIKSP